MISFLCRLWQDRRGNALAIAGAALPLLIGSAGLATDTIEWALWKRQIQRAADSAAIAGAYARVGGGTASTAVTADLTKNNHLWMGWATGYPVTTTPADSGGFTNQVRVSLGVSQKLSFSSLFISSPPLITGSATAAAVDDGSYCLIALDSTTTSGVTIGGSANAHLGCGVISNSISSTASVGTNGSSYNLTASPVASVGGMPSSINGATNLQPYHLAMTDPYAGLYSTAVPSGMTCKNNINAGTVAGIVQPGCYNNFNPGNGTTTLAPGVYYLNNASLSTNGTTVVTGTGVTLIFTGTNPGSLSMNGNSVINLTAPTTGPYAKMLMIQSSSATSGNSNTINGNNSSGFDGAIYFPKGLLNFTGSSSPATKCAMIVALRVDISGNTDIQNNTSGCTANTTVAGKKIRLVA